MNLFNKTSAFLVFISFIITLDVLGMSARRKVDEDSKFTVATIPAELEDTDAVVRLYEYTFEVKNPGKAKEKVRRVVTILNPNGREFGTIWVIKDRFRKLKSLDGKLLDARGKKIRDLEKSDKEDYSAISNYSLYDNYRIEIARLYHDDYPYTVELEYEVERDGLIGWPTWYPQQYGEAVEYARFELKVPAEMKARYHLRGLTIQPQRQYEDDDEILRWEVTLRPPRYPEPHGPKWGVQAPSVLTAPDVFEIADYSGDMSSWVSFGKWFHELAKDRTDLPATAVDQIRRICKNAPTTRAKVQALYEHLQATTRYVSVQLGIGAWQPFKAEYVFNRGYGDCKALTNYMLAMLKAVDITAYPVLIRSGQHEPDVIPDFPSQQFNHVILLVPMDEDSLWLECTSQTIPFGHIGAANENRNALVIHSGGGTLVRTPRSRPSDNQQIRIGEITIDSQGQSQADLLLKYSGNELDRVRVALAGKTSRERQQWLRRELDVPRVQIIETDFSRVDEKRQHITLPVTVKFPIGTVLGRRLFLKPTIKRRWKKSLPQLNERTQPIEFSYPFFDADTVVLKIPEGYKLEHIPQPVTLETSFARYQSIVSQGTSELSYVREFELRVKSLPPGEYEEFRKFIDEIIKAEQRQVMLVKEN